MKSLLVRTTLPNESAANKLAAALIAPGLAACAHVMPMTSHFEWKGRQEESEWLVEARTLPACADAVRAKILDMHSYEVPLVETIESVVDEAYGAWMESQLSA